MERVNRCSRSSALHGGSMRGRGATTGSSSMTTLVPLPRVTASSPHASAAEAQFVSSAKKAVPAPKNSESLLAAGLVAETLVHPAQTISTRAKLHPSSHYGGFFGAGRTILAEEGVRGILAGVKVTALVAAPQTAVYFGVYEAAKRVGLTASGNTNSPIVYFVAGGVAELAASLLFVPAEVLRNRFMMGANPARATGGRVARPTNYASLGAAVRTIYSEKGLRGFVVGWRSCLLEDCAYSALQFLCYEQYKHAFQAVFGRDMGAGDTIVAGAVAGATASLVTNPLAVVTTRLTTQDANNKFGTGIVSCLSKARQETGLGLWRGSVPRMLSFAALASIQFTVYEQVMQAIDERQRY